VSPISKIDRQQCVSDVQYKNILKYPHLDLDDPIAKLTPMEIIQQQVSLQDSILTEGEQQNLYEMILAHKEAF
jgi:hypothetical protein